MRKAYCAVVYDVDYFMIIPIFEVNHIFVFCILDNGYDVVLCNFILKKCYPIYWGQVGKPWANNTLGFHEMLRALSFLYGIQE